MSHHNGHGHDEHGHDAHGDEHAHGVLAGAADVIPETSLQDKFLVLLCGLALAALLYYGCQWAFALKAPHPAGGHAVHEQPE
ncbi:MAG TPA: hypothetical protein V6D08_08595 [Candidatus Obscuribacterales bacterium]